MSESPSTMNPEPNNQTPSPDHFSKIAFWKVGIIETLAGAVILLLIFGVLNYFNILPLSDVFPKYFGFLPRQQSESSTIPISVNKITPIPTPTVTTISLEAARNIFTDFLPQVLNPSLISTTSNISFKEYEGANNNFSATWINPTIANVVFVISQDQKILNSINIYITEENDSTPSAVIANELTSKSFSLTPQGEWKCKPLASKGIYCENFWQDANGVKTGIGLMQPIITGENKDKKIIFMCQYGKDSELYSWKSCSNEFAESGV